MDGLIKKIEDMSLNAWPSRTVSRNTDVSERRPSLRSVLLFHRILIICWKTGDMRFST